MSTQELSWQDAVLQVLRENGGAMHYTAIADEIIAKQLRPPIPSSQAATNQALRALLNVDGRSPRAVREIEGNKGTYALRTFAVAVNNRARAEELEAQSKGLIKIEAFGLYWRRDVVNWQSGGNRLLGRQNRGAQTVDFADQDGIYLLHDGRDIMYVGQTYTPDANYGLYSRLRAHDDDPRKTVYWDAFSWFGFRPVAENGSLLPPSNTATVGSVINVIEAMFIEALLPRLNQQSGQGMDQARSDGLYIQVADCRT